MLGYSNKHTRTQVLVSQSCLQQKVGGLVGEIVDSVLAQRKDEMSLKSLLAPESKKML